MNSSVLHTVLDHSQQQGVELRDKRFVEQSQANVLTRPDRRPFWLASALGEIRTSAGVVS